MKQKLLSIITVVGTLTLTACGGGSSDSNSQPDKLIGAWERTGYGEVLMIENQSASYYQLSPADCMLIDTVSVTDLQPLIQNPDFDQTLVLSEVDDSVFVQQYSRLQSLPTQCEPNNLITASDPVTVFDYFKNSYEQFYAFFGLRGVDWAQTTQELEASVSTEMSDDELFITLATALSEVDDGHVRIEADEQVYSPSTTRGANRVIEETFLQQSEFDDIQDYANSLNAAFWENLENYFDEDSINVIDGALPARFLTATINDGKTGYLMISSMAFFSSENDGLDLQSNLGFVENYFPQIMSSFDNTDNLIIDIRFNSGGHDEISFNMASYFFDQDTLVGSKYAKTPTTESAYQEAWVKGRQSNAYLKPIVLITGEETASAAEIFTLAMTQKSNVTHIGQTTSGMLSDVLEKELPNGWTIWLANEIYQDPNGNRFESVGFIPSQAVSTFSVEAIQAGNDLAVVKALELLN